ncbi:GNAT family N-acetyltransferase [Paenibacillus prosopidis]|nr:GNAT family N-acetyltransferase [Paenibacillus prosopidis]
METNMKSNIIFEGIQEKHLSKIRDIYNYYVLNTTISFHTEALTINEIRASVMNQNAKYKSYVIVEEELIKGYILITQHKNKQAYDVTAEVTIYLDPNHLGEGIGSAAIPFVEEAGRNHGFHVLIATICTENERSARLFERHGYIKCAHFKEIGFKFGRRLDIVSYQKIIG